MLANKIRQFVFSVFFGAIASSRAPRDNVFHSSFTRLSGYRTCATASAFVFSDAPLALNATAVHAATDIAAGLIREGFT
jgi:hypothetical protein